MCLSVVPVCNIHVEGGTNKHHSGTLAQKKTLTCTDMWTQKEIIYLFSLTDVCQQGLKN